MVPGAKSTGDQLPDGSSLNSNESDVESILRDQIEVESGHDIKYRT